MEPGGSPAPGRWWWRRWWWTAPVGLLVVAGALALIDLVWTAAGIDPARRMDAARTTFTIVVGLGGVVTLAVLIHRQVVAAAEHKRQLADQEHRIADAERRFRQAEDTAAEQRRDAERRFEQAERIAADNKAHSEKVAAAAQRDATERRAQELFVKAVEQLGHDKAAVRLGAIHALDALGQEHAGRRRVVMDVWCAYLRMPPPGEQSTPKPMIAFGAEPAEPAVQDPVWPAEVLQVRATAQRLIADHLRDSRTADASVPSAFWGAMDIDLTGAHLHDADFRHCHIKEATFTDARCTGQAGFVGAKFNGPAWFNGAEFAGPVGFGGARFGGPAWFDRAKFTEEAGFDRAKFAEDVWFASAKFTGEAEFSEVTFAGFAGFGDAEFAGRSRFDGAEFEGPAWFGDAEFAGRASFIGTRFVSDARFDGAKFNGQVRFDDAQFSDPSAMAFDGARTSLPQHEHVWPSWWRVGEPTKDSRPLERKPANTATADAPENDEGGKG